MKMSAAPRKGGTLPDLKGTNEMNNANANPYAFLADDLTDDLNLAPVTVDLSADEYGKLVSLARRWFGAEIALDKVASGYISAVESIRAGRFKGDLDDRSAVVSYVAGHVKNVGRNARRKDNRAVAVGGESEVMDLRVYADAGRVFDSPERRVMNAQLLGKLWPEVKKSPELLAQVVHGVNGSNTDAKRRQRQREALAVYLAD
jgi:hypothetical protein